MVYFTLLYFEWINFTLRHLTPLNFTTQNFILLYIISLFGFRISWVQGG